MPVYADPGVGNQWTCLNPGDMVAVWSAETPGSGGKSQAVALSPQRFGESVKAFSVELIFAAGPTSGEIDVEVSNTPADADFVLLPGGAITLGAGTVYQADFQTAHKYVRLRQVGALGTPGSLTGNIAR